MLSSGFALLLCAGAANAGATLFGDSVNVDLVGGINLSDVGVVVGPGVELQGGDFSTNWGAFLFASESIDIGETTISMAFDTALGEFGMLTFSDLDFGAGIGDVALISTIPEVTDAQLSFTTNSVTLDLTDWFALGTPGTMELRLTEVPAPSALALLGFGGLVGARRRR